MELEAAVNALVGWLVQLADWCNRLRDIIRELPLCSCRWEDDSATGASESTPVCKAEGGKWGGRESRKECLIYV